jgi:hypothetical protein
MLAGATGAALAGSTRATDPPDLWALLRGGGQIVLMRHGLTDPPTSEPPGARVEDCATQRNLGEPGRAEARRVGAAFRAHGVPVGAVLSSRWCRCLETARLAFGRVEPWRDLEFAGWADTPEKRRRARVLREFLGKLPPPGPPAQGNRDPGNPAPANTVLVSHGFVIEPLMGISPRTAEFFVITPQPGGGFRLAGHLAPDQLD